MKQIGDQVMGVKTVAAMAALMAVAALAIAGCGDSSDATGDGTTASADADTALTKATLIKRADAICARTDDIQRQGLEEFEKRNPGAVRAPKGLEQLVVEVALPAIRTEIEELKALPAPTDEKAPFEGIVGAFEKALRSAEKRPLSIAKFLGPFEEPAEMAKFFGLKECGNPL